MRNISNSEVFTYPSLQQFHVNHIEPPVKLAPHLFEERHTLKAKLGVDGDTCPGASVISLQFGLQFIRRTIGKHVYSWG